MKASDAKDEAAALVKKFEKFEAAAVVKAKWARSDVLLESLRGQSLELADNVFGAAIALSCDLHAVFPAQSRSFSTSFGYLTEDVSGNKIGVEGAKALATALEKNSSVTSINLRRNHIGDEGSKALAILLKVARRDGFHRAVGDGNIEAVKQFLDGGVDTFSKVDGTNMLLFALRKGQLEMVLLLVKSRYGRALLMSESGLVLYDIVKELEKIETTALSQRIADSILETLPKTERYRELMRHLICKPLQQRLWELRAAREDVFFKWRAVEALLHPSKWLDARSRTETALEAVLLPTLHQTAKELASAEVALDFDKRLKLRTALRSLIQEGRPKIAACLVAADQEMDVIRQLKPYEQASMGVFAATRQTVADFTARVDRISLLGRALDSMKATIAELSEAGSRRCAEQQLLAAKLEEEVSELIDAATATNVERAVELAKKHVGAQLAPRAKMLQAKRHELIVVASDMERKLAEVERALEAGSRIERAKTDVAAAQKALERSKRGLVKAQADEKDILDDFADGTEGEAAVAEAKSKVVEANMLVEQKRFRYEEAVRQLVAVRQAGFPELRCPTMSREDRFPQVPTIDAKDLGELQPSSRLGKGSFASVYEVELPLVGPCAFKKLDGSIGRETLMREAAALWELRHSEHIVRLLMVCDEPGKLGLVLELVDGGSLGALLHERREKLNETEMLQILHDVAAGLECVHAHKQVHLDVKGDNVLLTSKRRAKLSDFGSSKVMRNTYRDTMVQATRQWSAPETIADMPQIGPACDIWSYGMLMYEMLTGKIPHAEVPEMNLLAHVWKGATPDVAGIDAKFVGLLHQCWQKDPALRPTATQLLIAIGGLMKRDCCSCLSSVALTGGIVSSVNDAFLCNGCVNEAMESQLKTSSAWRSDGAMVLGQSVFQLSQTRHVVSTELFELWQQQQQQAKEKEVRESLKAEIAKEKRRWDEMGTAERAAMAILNDVLPFSCPGCRGKIVYDKGCFAMRHGKEGGGCGAGFCVFCEGVFPDAHGHVQTCSANTLGLPWYPNEHEAHAIFDRVQRERQIRELRVRFVQMEEALRDAVFERVKEQLRSLSISKRDVIV